MSALAAGVLTGRPRAATSAKVANFVSHAALKASIVLYLLFQHRGQTLLAGVRAVERRDGGGDLLVERLVVQEIADQQRVVGVGARAARRRPCRNVRGALSENGSNAPCVPGTSGNPSQVDSGRWATCGKFACRRVPASPAPNAPAELKPHLRSPLDHARGVAGRVVGPAGLADRVDQVEREGQRVPVAVGVKRASANSPSWAGSHS